MQLVHARDYHGQSGKLRACEENVRPYLDATIEHGYIRFLTVI